LRKILLQFPISKHRNCYVYNEHLSHITVSTFQESSIEIAMAETISEAILEPHSQTIIPVKIPPKIECTSPQTPIPLVILDFCTIAFGFTQCKIYWLMQLMLAPLSTKHLTCWYSTLASTDIWMIMKV
jgi:hypothetical protein